MSVRWWRVAVPLGAAAAFAFACSAFSSPDASPPGEDGGPDAASDVVADTGTDAPCAIRTDDSLWCWGDDSFGQLARGTTGGASAEPVRVPFDAGVASAAAGSVHACAIDHAGALSCWGWNDFTQLGVPRDAGPPGDA